MARSQTDENDTGDTTPSALSKGKAKANGSQQSRETAKPEPAKQALDDGTLTKTPGDGPNDSFPLEQVVKGREDKRGRPILDVLWAVHDFRIFKTDKGISPHFSDDEKVAAGQRERYLALGSELAQMNHLIHLLSQYSWQRRRDGEQPDSSATQLYYERELARGIAQALIGDAEEGKATLTALAKRLEKRLRNKGRVIYFAMCLISAFVIVVLASLFLANATGLDRTEMALAAIMGSLGALLSTAAGLRRLRIDAGATWVMNWVYGGQRMLVGVLGAVVLYLAVRAGIAMELMPGLPADTAKPDTLDPYKLSFISVLAGFSERLVPNLLDREPGDNGEGTGSDNSVG